MGQFHLDSHVPDISFLWIEELSNSGCIFSIHVEVKFIFAAVF